MRVLNIESTTVRNPLSLSLSLSLFLSLFHFPFPPSLPPSLLFFSPTVSLFLLTGVGFVSIIVIQAITVAQCLSLPHREEHWSFG